ncbi:hypothetical protein QQX98_001321 [Neonectria punicea]|uniref:Amidase domain-containing protein n=1 Tax=Neonectria punicea TaxID=979145 RepID=A0ABR1HR56_9HYPO
MWLQQGIVPICLEFDSAGPVARCAEDIASLMDIMADPSYHAKKPAGGYSSSLTGSLEGLRIGVLDPKDWHLPPGVATLVPEVDAQQENEVAAAYDKLRAAGAVVKQVQIAPLDGLELDGVSQMAQVMNSGFKSALESYLKDLEVSKVRTLAELMQFMTENADLGFPPESPNMTRLEGAARFALSAEERRKA